MTELETRKDQALAAIAAAATPEAVEALRVEALGKQGWISLALKTLGAMSAEERTAQAPAIQAARAEVADAIAAKKDALESAELERRLATLDVADLPVLQVHADAAAAGAHVAGGGLHGIADGGGGFHHLRMPRHAPGQVHVRHPVTPEAAGIGAGAASEKPRG
ncbi:hypothetical protein J4558_17940 [Leptolyngbya sp. 15MV]|nr:hypothetical protein J4558_17940 [Leptolyngbya sp. 15MV]